MNTGGRPGADNGRRGPATGAGTSVYLGTAYVVGLLCVLVGAACVRQWVVGSSKAGRPETARGVKVAVLSSYFLCKADPGVGCFVTYWCTSEECYCERGAVGCVRPGGR